MKKTIILLGILLASCTKSDTINSYSNPMADNSIIGKCLITHVKLEDEKEWQYIPYDEYMWVAFYSDMSFESKENNVKFGGKWKINGNVIYAEVEKFSFVLESPSAALPNYREPSPPNISIQFIEGNSAIFSSTDETSLGFLMKAKKE